MSASPQRLHHQERGSVSGLLPAPPSHTLDAPMLRFFRLLRLAVWRAFEHDAFAVAKAAAYSSIFTFFPMLLVVGAVLAASRRTEKSTFARSPTRLAGSCQRAAQLRLLI